MLGRFVFTNYWPWALLTFLAGPMNMYFYGSLPFWFATIFSMLPLVWLYFANTKPKMKVFTSILMLYWLISGGISVYAISME